MARFFPPRVSARPFLWLFLCGVPLVVTAAACDSGPLPNGKGKAGPVAGTAPGTAATPDGAPLSFQASISQVETNWRDGQQTFVLTLTNTGEALATVHAIVYGCNESIQPPRRAISPPTAFDWFALAESIDGRLTPQDIEKHWKDNAFIDARGAKLKSSEKETVPPGASRAIKAAHVLDDASKFAATKGKPLQRRGITEYRVWLFSGEGKFFLEHKEKDVKATVVDAPLTRPDTHRPPADPEKLAADALGTAQYHLKTGQTDKARRELQDILEKYPQTAAATTARKLLKEMKAN